MNLILLVKTEHISSKQHQLFRIFSGCPATLIGEVYDIAILTVGEVKDLDVALLRQVSFDPVHSGLEALLSVYETSIYGELAAFETFVEQEFAKISRRFALPSGIGGQVEHNEYPHDPVS